MSPTRDDGDEGELPDWALLGLMRLQLEAMLRLHDERAEAWLRRVLDNLDG